MGDQISLLPSSNPEIMDDVGSVGMDYSAQSVIENEHHSQQPQSNHNDKNRNRNMDELTATSMTSKEQPWQQRRQLSESEIMSQADEPPMQSDSPQSQQGATSNGSQPSTSSSFGSAVTTAEEQAVGGKSSIRYIQDPNTGQPLREGHLMVLLPLSRRFIDPNTQQSIRQLIEFRVYVELSAFLAFKHIQRRSGSVLPDLPRRLESCDFTWTYQHHDTEFSPLQAAKALVNYGNFDGHQSSSTSSDNFESNSTTTGNGNGNGDDYIDEPKEEPIFNNSNSTSNITTVLIESNATESFSAAEEQIVVVAGDDTFEGQDEIPSNVEEDAVETALPSDGPTPTGEDPKQNATMISASNLTVLNIIPFNDNLDDVSSLERQDSQQLQPFDRRRKRKCQLQQQQEQQHFNNNATLPTPRSPFAMMGAARSVVSQTLATLGYAYDLPQISSSSTASTLDGSPMFARTVPTNRGDAHALMAYLHYLQVRHVGILFIKDDWGRRYEQDLQDYATIFNVTVYSVAYVDEGKLDSAMLQLKRSQVRYFIGIINPNAWKSVVRMASQYGIMGHSDYQWFLADLVELVGDNFVLDRATEWDLAQALHGTGVVSLKVNPYRAFDRAVAAFADNRVMQEEFISLHSEPHLFDNFTFTPFPGRSLFQYLTYDAVIALGLTACDTPGLFTGQQFYDQLLKIDFEGVSGRVNLHEKTGTRLGEGLQYQIVNMVLQNEENVPYEQSASVPSTPSSWLSFDPRLSITIDLSPKPTSRGKNNSSNVPLIEVNAPFMYNDYTTTKPLPLPPVEENMNLIPNGIRYFGLTLAVFAMVLSIACAAWAYTNRKKYVVRASQPIFLIQICVGTFIIASTIVPLSFQEDMPGLNVACMSIPWFVCIGFCVTIAALFSKAHRINKLMKSGTTFRRVQVKPADVMRPFFILLTINIALLTGWTASPWRISWHREYLDNFDTFNRNVESYGICKADNKLFWALLVPLVVANVSIMVIATYESYKGRNLPSEFSETRYLAFAMISLCETFTLGATTIVAVLKQPTAFFLVMTLVLFIACMSILVPVFLPKYLQRHKEEKLGRKTVSLLSEHTTSNYNWAVMSPSLIARSENELLNDSSGRNSASSHRGSALNSMSRTASLSRAASDFFASHPQAIQRGSSGAHSAGGSSAGGRKSSGFFGSGSLGFAAVNSNHQRKSRPENNNPYDPVDSKKRASTIQGMVHIPAHSELSNSMDSPIREKLSTLPEFLSCDQIPESAASESGSSEFFEDKPSEDGRTTGTLEVENVLLEWKSKANRNHPVEPER